jgi:hypothetical protein
VDLLSADILVRQTLGRAGSPQQAPEIGLRRARPAATLSVVLARGLQAAQLEASLERIFR